MEYLFRKRSLKINAATFRAVRRWFPAGAPTAQLRRRWRLA
jgi:hypothetical protein